MAQVVTWGVGAPEPAAALDGAAGMRALAASGAHQVQKPPLLITLYAHLGFTGRLLG